VLRAELADVVAELRALWLIAAERLDRVDELLLELTRDRLADERREAE
jgi:hypothetical protein